MPQHDAPNKGRQAAQFQFINWAETLSCGIDLMTTNHDGVPDLPTGLAE